MMKSLAANLLICISIFLVIPAEAFGNELEQRKAIQHEAYTAFKNENFSELERLAGKYRSSRSRTSSGLWKLTLFYMGVASAYESLITDDKYWVQMEKTTARWIELYPQSAAAHLSYAQMLINRGWMYRKKGHSHTVQTQNLQPFREHVQKARKHLEKHKPAASRDPRWYEMMANIAYQQSWPKAEFQGLLNEGLGRYPSFYQIYFAAMDYFAPTWGGNAASVEEFAMESLKRTKASEGFGMYARIYWYASQTQYGDRLFAESQANWATMKAGIDDVLKKYPDKWNTENFAKFACMSGDKAKTAELMRRIEEPPLMAAWGEIETYEQCKAWVRGKYVVPFGQYAYPIIR